MTKVRHKPPRLVDLILKVSLAEEEYSEKSGDLEEVYRCLAEESGIFRAKIWYWAQTLKAMPSFLINSIYWRHIMFKNYMQIAWRNLKRHKAYSFINITGLAIGLACCVMIMLWIQNELSYDRYHQHADDIYRVARDITEGTLQGQKAITTSPPLAPALRDGFPEIVEVTRIARRGDRLFSYGQSHFLERDFFFADNSIFKIFTFSFIKGDKTTALNIPNSLVISESMAEKYFGDEDPIGKIIILDEKTDFVVTGVIREMPSNSHFVANIILPFETIAKIEGIDLSNWGWNGFYTYVLLHPNANRDALESKFETMLQEYQRQGFYFLRRERLFLQPLKSIHLQSHFRGEISPNIHVSTLILFGTIAFLILLIACINYMNLVTARSSFRLREIGTRKVVGAHQSQIAKQFLGESIFAALFSLGISIILVELFLPLFNRFAGRQLALDGGSFIRILPAILILVLFVGLIAGSYPAFYLSSLNPINVLKGSTGIRPKRSRLRNALVVFQFSISIILIFATLQVKDQLHFIRNKEMGYDRDHIVILTMIDSEARKRLLALKEELKRNPEILNISSSQFLPNDVRSSTWINWPTKPEGLVIPIHAGEVDYDFIDLYGIEIVQGRNFSREFSSDRNGAFLINESAMKALGPEFHLGMDFGHWGSPESSGKVVGVMKDFHFLSLHEEIKPLYLFLNPDVNWRLSIKIRGGNIRETLQFMGETMKKFSPHYPFEYRFFDEEFNRVYQTEQKIESIISIFALIAIFIACLGVFGLAAFTAEQKTKEIGIRKVLGASVSEIVYLLTRDLIRWVVLANIIAWPVAFYAMQRWLQNFAYRTNISAATFILSGLLALCIAVSTFSFQTFKAAAANPVDSLRYE